MPPIPQFDLYGELEVSRSASVETIEAAFKSLVKRFHPDVSQDADTERIKRINVAREWLTDPDRRRRYDAAIRRQGPLDDREDAYTAGSRTGRRGSRGRDGSGPGGDRPDAGNRGSGWTADWQPESPTRSGFGVNTVAVRGFLAELRELDEPRAQEVRAAKRDADIAGYDSARSVAFAASRAHRLSEWLFAREAATVIVRRRLGETPLAAEVVEPVADVAGAIAIRDLLTATDFDLLSMPWTKRGGGVLDGAPRARAGAPTSASGGGAPKFDGRTTPRSTGADRVHHVATANMAGGRTGANGGVNGGVGSAGISGSGGPAGSNGGSGPFGSASADSPTGANGGDRSANRHDAGASGAGNGSGAGVGYRAAGNGRAASPTASSTMASSVGTSFTSATAGATAVPGAAMGPIRTGIHLSAATGVALTSVALIVVLALAAFGGQLTGAPGHSGQPGGAAGASSSPGTAIGSSLPTGPATQPPTPAPSATQPGGIDPALLSRLQQGAWQAIQDLTTAAANGDVASAKVLLGASAPDLQVSGLTHAVFPKVDASAIVVARAADGIGYVATAGQDHLTSTDGSHWTFAYGNRPLARYGRTVTHDVYWREPLGQHDIDVTLTSITITRTQLVVGVSWTFGPDPTYGNDGPYFTNDQLEVTAVTSGGADVPVPGTAFATLDGSAGKATARIDAVVSPTASLSLEVTIVNHGSAASLRAFTTIPVTFQVH